jgi:hypothetical protein
MDIHYRSKFRYLNIDCFAEKLDLSFVIWGLPFDVAQGGEPVEPFVI